MVLRVTIQLQKPMVTVDGLNGYCKMKYSRNLELDVFIMYLYNERIKLGMRKLSGVINFITNKEVIKLNI